jgi:hypothetical protein
MQEVQYRIGATKTDITPSDWQRRTYWMAGYGVGRPVTSVHDPLYARTLVMDDGTSPLAIVSVDLLGLTSPDVQLIQERIAAAVPELADRILIHSTHSHEGPDTIGLWGGTGLIPFLEPRSISYIKAIANQAAAAVKSAWDSRELASVTVANIDQSVVSDLVVDSRPPLVSDPKARLLVFSAGDRVLGTLVNWASHPEVLGNENQALTADYVKWLVDEVEAQLGGSALFVNGAIGGLLTSASGRILPNVPSESFEKAAAIGQAVAQRLLQQLKTPGPNDQVATYATLPSLQYATRDFYLPISNSTFLAAKTLNRVPTRFYREDEIPPAERLTSGGTLLTRYARTEGNFIDLGPISILTMGGELYPELLVGGIDPSRGIAPYNQAPAEVSLLSNPAWQPDPFQFFFGLTNDFIGYVIPQSEWDGWNSGQYGEEFATDPQVGSILSENLHLLMLGYTTGEYPDVVPEVLRGTNDQAGGKDINYRLLWQDVGQNQLNYGQMQGMTFQQANPSSLAPLAATEGWQIAARNDFNQDGGFDLFWVNGRTGENQFWQLKGDRLEAVVASGIGSIGGDSGWQVGGSGDFDGDRQTDLFWYNVQTGETAFWKLNGFGFQEAIFAKLPGTDVTAGWRAGGANDFDGDRQMDLFWYNENTGETAFWRLKAFTGQELVSVGLPNIGGNSGWQPAATGDFDGDQDPDLFWSNTQTGATAFWRMQNFAFQEPILQGLPSNPLTWQATPTAWNRLS